MKHFKISIIFIIVGLFVFIGCSPSPQPQVQPQMQPTPQSVKQQVDYATLQANYNALMGENLRLQAQLKAIKMDLENIQSEYSQLKTDYDIDIETRQDLKKARAFLQAYLIRESPIELTPEGWFNVMEKVLFDINEPILFDAWGDALVVPDEEFKEVFNNFWILFLQKAMDFSGVSFGAE